MTDQEKLLAWCKKNPVHDYRLGTSGYKLLMDALEERYYNQTKEIHNAY